MCRRQTVKNCGFYRMVEGVHRMPQAPVFCVMLIRQ